MFEDKFGARAEAIALQSLEIGSNVAESVVNAWAHVLNDDPSFSLPGMPRRLFCVHTTMVNKMPNLLFLFSYSLLFFFGKKGQFL
ncbi:hypothetical protein Hanom_Chr00s000007g01614901 [Helianthus anomalus]